MLFINNYSLFFSDSGTLNLSSQNRSVMDRLGSQLHSHLQSVQLVSGGGSDNTGSTPAFTFTAGISNSSRRENKPVPILPHPASTTTLLITPITPSQSSSQVCIHCI